MLETDQFFKSCILHKESNKTHRILQGQVFRSLAINLEERLLWTISSHMSSSSHQDSQIHNYTSQLDAVDIFDPTKWSEIFPIPGMIMLLREFNAEYYV